MVSEALDILSMQGMITIAKDNEIGAAEKMSKSRLELLDRDMISKLEEVGF
jgi:hypothetical protein